MKRICVAATVAALFAAVLPLGAQETQEEAGPTFEFVVGGQEGDDLSEALDGVDLGQLFGEAIKIGQIQGQDGEGGFGITVAVGTSMTMDKLAFDELASGHESGLLDSGLFGGGGGFGGLKSKE
ncbi:MAG: hypothetical protein HY716_06170 [Planctomycetes bacterium]|nr:hypothetical protein [Planctomycetota bacterium]